VFEGVYWYELVRLYYFNPAKAKEIINAQDKGSYTLTHVAGTEGPRQYTATYNSVTYPVSDQTMFLPMPEAEIIKAPNLLKEPVAFDFSVIPD
jgi:starch-binding outer membrane protein, SusD/RagB family